MRADWTEQVVSYLRRCKRDGHGFSESWDGAMRKFPARSRDLGEYRPTLFAEGPESVVEFFRRVCDDAWHDRQPALRHFSVSAMRDARVDADGPAVGRGASRRSAEVA